MRLVYRLCFLSSLLLCLAVAHHRSFAAARPAVAILGALLPATEGQPAEQTRNTLLQRGYPVTILTGEQLADPALFNSAKYSLLIVPHADVFPAAAQENLLAFLIAKGKLLCLGGPPFLRYAYSMNGQWQTVDASNNNKGNFSVPNTGRMPNGAPFPTVPVLESLSPWYKLQNDDANIWLPIWRYFGATAVAPPGRLVRLDSGKASAWIYRTAFGPYAGAVWGAINAPTAAAPGLLLKAVAEELRTGCVLYGGPSLVSYRQGAPVTFQSMIDNTGSTPFSVHCAANVMPVPAGALSQAKRVSAAVQTSVAPGQEQSLTVRWPRFLTPGDYQYTLAFTDRNGVTVDQISNRFTVLPAKPKPEDFVTIKNGDFQLDGKPWHPIGVNYFPLWVSGESLNEQRRLVDNVPEDWREWLAPDQYDPNLIERDLTLAQNLGINALTILNRRTDYAPTLRDFLARCHAHGIHVNVFVDGGFPLNLHLDHLISLITAADLPNNATVFAYDIAWEPFVGHQADRKRYDSEWEQWLIHNYGTVENAEKDWGVTAPREDGKLTNPPDEQFTTDGPWRRMTSAYHRFLDDDINWGYRQVQSAIRAVDTHHPISTRSGCAGNGNLLAEAVLAFDLRAGAKHLDFISPEGYSLSGDRQTFLGGGAFNVAYARWASGGKPVMWAEFGTPVYPYGRQEINDMQTDFWDKMMQVVLTSGSNGAIGWIWQGGVRVDEVSDYGIINPDGTPRPSARKLQQYAPQIKDRVLPLPGKRVEFVFDRDKDARGYNAVWTSGSPAVGAAVLAGDVPVLKTEATGTSTATMPLVAVGNVPATGSNPLKYANGEFSTVRTEPKSIGLNGVRIFVTAGNTGEASWSTEGAGRVALLVRVDGKLVQTVPLPHPVARFEDVTFPELDVPVSATSTLVLRLAVLDRNPALLEFGERVTLSGTPLYGGASVIGHF